MHSKDLSLPYQTVDNPFMYSFQPYHKLQATIGNEWKDDLDLSFKARDVITIDGYTYGMEGYYSHGYRYGKQLGTNKMIKFPNFKVEEYVETYESLAFN